MKHFTQTKEFEKYYDKIFKSKFHTLKEETKDNKYFCSYFKNDILSVYKNKYFFLRVLPALYRTVVYYGPVSSEEHHEEAILGVLDFLKKDKAVELIPNIYMKINYNSILKNAEKMGYDTEKKATVILNLAEIQLKELFESYDKRLRKNINRLGKRLTFERVKNVHELKVCFELYYETMKRNKLINNLTFEAYKTLFELKDNSDFFILYNEEKIPLASQLATKNEGIINLTGVSIGDYALQHESSANDFLQWKIIEYYKNEGANMIDWVGYTLDAKENTKEYNINKFKTKFGGKIKEYYIFKKETFIIKKIRKFQNWLKR